MQLPRPVWAAIGGAEPSVRARALRHRGISSLRAAPPFGASVWQATGDSESSVTVDTDLGWMYCALDGTAVGGSGVQPSTIANLCPLIPVRHHVNWVTDSF